MVILEINNNTYRAFESWNEITVKKARELFKVASTAPDDLLYIYKEEAKGKEADQDQINLRLKSLDEKELQKFFVKVFECLSNVPSKVIKKCFIGDVQALYSNYLLKFVFGVLHFPLEKQKRLKKFNWCGVDYYAPEFKKIMGTKRYFHNEETQVFCDASDLDKDGRKSEFGKYKNAEMIIATIFREKDKLYEEKEMLETADKHFNEDITCDVFHGALVHLSEVNSVLQLLFPNLYESSGDMISKQATEASGLADFGWLTSITTIAKMQLLNERDLTPLASVQKSNLYDFMTVLSNNRAENDFQQIYRERINRK